MAINGKKQSGVDPVSRSLITRFRNELLNAELDLNSSSITQEHDGAIAVTAKLKPARLFFAALFTLPCLYFLYYVIGNPGIVNLAVALIFCPVLALMAVLIGGVVAGKSIDRRDQQARKSLRLLSFSTEVSEPLALQGVITLAWKWSKFGDQPKGYNKYSVTVAPGTGLVFITTNDYQAARAFAERLSNLLSFRVEDSVPQRNRS